MLIQDSSKTRLTLERTSAHYSGGNGDDRESNLFTPEEGRAMGSQFPLKINLNKITIAKLMFHSIFHFRFSQSIRESCSALL